MDPERIYSIRLPIDGHSRWFELNNVVDSQLNCLGKSPRGPWPGANQPHDPCELLEHIGNRFDSVHAEVRHIQLNIQCRLDPNLSKQGRSNRKCHIFKMIFFYGELFL